MISTTTPGATIRYTTDGNDPTTASPSVASGGTVLVDRSMTLKARAWKGADASVVRDDDYVISGAVALGARHTVALKSDGTVWAWGDNDRGQVGKLGQDPLVVVGEISLPLVRHADRAQLATGGRHHRHRQNPAGPDAFARGPPAGDLAW